MEQQKHRGLRFSRTELEVDGMTCGMCAQAVEAAVRGLNGAATSGSASDSGDGAGGEQDPLEPPSRSGRIVDVKVSLTTDTVLVEWEEPEGCPGGDSEGSAAISEQKIIDAIQDVGYRVAGVLSSGGTHRMSGSRRSDPSPRNDDPATVSSTARSLLQPTARLGEPIRPRGGGGGRDDDSVDGGRGGGDHDWDSVQRRWDRLRERQHAKVQQRRDAFLLSLALAFPVLVLTMVLPRVSPGISLWLESVRVAVYHWQVPLQALLLLTLATLTQFVCGYEFYRGTWYSFKSRRAGMDLLVCLGTTASYLYAIRGMIHGGGSAVAPDDSHAQPHHEHWDEEDATHFFETSTTLIAFVLAGKWMQASAVQRTGSAIASLLELRSSTAIKITPFKDRQNFNPLKDPYKEATIPIEDVREGDLVKILPGNSVPADGKVVFGQVCVDESMLTGESIPVYKATGAVVLGGTVCVESSISDPSLAPGRGSPEATAARSMPLGILSRVEDSPSSVGAAFVQVTGVGAATALSQIIKLVTDAQLASSVTPIQNVADTVASYFVPTVVALSVATTLGWYAACRLHVVPPEWYGSESAFTFSLLFGIAVLVISCPCALGLATPTAIMVSIEGGAKRRIMNFVSSSYSLLSWWYLIRLERASAPDWGSSSNPGSPRKLPPKSRPSFLTRRTP
jgi:Cu+-exporting ATPase